GVWRGGTGCLMGRRLKLLHFPATIYLCDSFQGVVKAGSTDSHYSGGEHADTSQSIVERLAASLDVRNIKILAGVFPEETAHVIDNLQFRLCHIDVDVYESGREILEWVWP